MIKLEWDQKIKEWKVEELIVTSIVCDGSAKCSTKWGIVGSGSGDVGWTGKDCGKLYSQDCWKDSLRVRSVCHRWTDPHWQRKKNVAGIYEVSAWSSSAREMTWEWFQKKKNQFWNVYLMKNMHKWQIHMVGGVCRGRVCLCEGGGQKEVSVSWRDAG